MGSEMCIRDRYVYCGVLSFNIKSIVNFEAREIPTFNAKVDILVEELNRLKYNGYKIILATNTLDRAKKLNSDLLDLGLESTISESRDIEIKSSQIIIIPARISSGFEYKSIKYAVCLLYTSDAADEVSNV